MGVLDKVRRRLHPADCYYDRWFFEEFDDAFGQVGRRHDTNTLQTIVDWITDQLDIGEDDDVLDVCCGNGLLTRELARHCNSVIGIDFSREALKTARDRFDAGNITYLQGDARSIGERFDPDRFDRTYCYLAFQYFDRGDGKTVLDGMRHATKAEGAILIGDVLDARRRWRFHDSMGARIRYMIGVALNTFSDVKLHDGKFWHPDEFRTVATDLGMSEVTLIEQTEELPQPSYRYDILLRP